MKLHIYVLEIHNFAQDMSAEEKTSEIAGPDCNYKQNLSALMPRRHFLCLAAKEAKGTKRETFSIGFPLGTPFPIDQGCALDPQL